MGPYSTIFILAQGLAAACFTFSRARSVRTRTKKNKKMEQRLAELKQELCKAERQRGELSAALGEVIAEEKGAQLKLERARASTKRWASERDALWAAAAAAAADAERAERDAQTVQHDVAALQADTAQYLEEIAELQRLIAEHRDALRSLASDVGVQAEARATIAELLHERDELREQARESARQVVCAQRRVATWLAISESLHGRLCDAQSVIAPSTPQYQ